MLYVVPGKCMLQYAIGDTVETFKGEKGRVINRYKRSQYTPTMVWLDTGIEIVEHHITKVWRNEDENR